MTDSTKPFARRLRLFLRDFRMLEAKASLAEAQSLTAFLATRKNYLHLQDVRWSASGERADFAVLRVAQLLWAGAPDHDVPIVSAPVPAQPRIYEIQVDGGLLIRAALHIGGGQRLGDYLEAAGPFIPLGRAHLLRSGRPATRANLLLGDVVLAQDGIQAVWESDADIHAAESARAEEDSIPAWGNVTAR